MSKDMGDDARTVVATIKRSYTRTHGSAYAVTFGDEHVVVFDDLKAAKQCAELKCGQQLRWHNNNRNSWVWIGLSGPSVDR